jgi:hypothetical protein
LAAREPNSELFVEGGSDGRLFKVRHDTTTSKLVLADGCT